MTVSEVLATLKLFAEKDIYLAPDLLCEKPKFGDGCSIDELVAFEKSIDNKLPQDYKQFLLLCGSISAPDIYNGYFINSLSLVEKLRRNKSFPNLIEKNNKSIELLPFGTDGGGNLFLMSLDTESTIWKWHHEFGANNGISLIAANFLNFLGMVRDDWEHFSFNDRDWKYLI